MSRLRLPDLLADLLHPSGGDKPHLYIMSADSRIKRIGVFLGNPSPWREKRSKNGSAFTSYRDSLAPSNMFFW